jgi:hypothetical protein
MAQSKHSISHGFGLFGITIVIGLIGWKFPIDTPDRINIFWIINMILLAIFSIVAGHGITGLWRGVLIDERNKMSLSRLQLALWTILIVASFLTAVLINIHRGQVDPLSITLHPSLWGLMGISTASLIGSPLIKSTKKDVPTNDKEKEKTVALLETQGVDGSKVSAEGQILVNQSPKDAGWSDLFKGDEVGNAAHLDLGKIQMFYFTLIVWFSYAVAISSQFASDSAKIAEFPDVSAGMVALLGISHAGYLANQAVPHTPQQSA